MNETEPMVVLAAREILQEWEQHERYVRNWQRHQIGIGVLRCPMDACTTHSGLHGDIYNFPGRRFQDFDR